MRRQRVRSWVSALAVLLLFGGVIRATGWREPPRFDGAGYATLALGLAEGQGYREVSHPTAARHSHFPPAYPAMLALVWGVAGVDQRADFVILAHGLSVGLTTLGFVAIIAWWRRVERPGVALPLTLALALNWQWHRNGGSIRSEPLALALTGVVLLLARRAGDSQGRGRVSLILLIMTLAAAILTRQVLVCLAAAVLIDLAWRRGWRWGLGAGLGVAALVAPWLVWQRRVGSTGQLGLFDGANLPALMATQALFYARRLPDSVLGPLVEVATVFARGGWLGAVATLGAVVLSSVALVGWGRLVRSPRRRLGALVPLLTLPLLLVWPFTEAGRFLVPLVPFVLMGFAEGGGAILARLGVRRGRRVAAWFLVVGAAPYSLYALATDRAGAERQSQAGFDAACRWLARPGLVLGPIMARHPADAAWLSGRLAVSIPEGGVDRILADIERWGVAYLVVDEGRYARDPANPLRPIVDDPGRSRRVPIEGTAGTAVYEVIRPSRRVSAIKPPG